MFATYQEAVDAFYRFEISCAELREAAAYFAAKYLEEKEAQHETS